jgi:uncharacterized protein YndB with AHSA1/START domain
MAAERSAAMELDERVLVIERIFDAPRTLVWKAWTEPEHMAKWQGPRGFTSTVLRNEPRPGGGYRIHMRGPDGDDHWTQGVIREFVPPERLSMAGSWTDAEGNPTSPETITTVTLQDHDGKTKLTLRQTGFESVTARDAHRGGWSSSLDCLAEYLASATLVASA